MDYFIGIVPSENQLNKLKQFRNQWPSNRIDEVVEPHITLKAQGGLNETQEWLDRVRQAANDFPAFSIQLGEPCFFGQDILYLSMDSPELKQLHEILVITVGTSPEQIEQYFEMDRFIAHLTLAKTSYGLSRNELEEMAAAARKELFPYPIVDVNSIRVYRKAADQQGYIAYMDIPLREKR